ncbi:unnamed protein product [Malus baccata var. baccata]
MALTKLHQLADVVVNLIFPVPDVNTQTTVKVKVVNKAEDEPESFAWSWRPETIDDTRLLAMGEGTANQLMDKKEAGNDSGSQWAQYYVFNYVFEKNVKLHPGKNIISLWSATVGFPVNLKRSKLEFLVLLYWFVGQNGDETVIKVLSAHKWPYIQAPLGTDPIAVDLQGKGHAWISGHSIGRYWPSYLSYDTGCSLDACAYRGSYDNKKYSFNCGNPTQRW